MKTISPALKTHLAQTTTTLAACWLIQRTDGALFAYTTLDTDLTISGQLYSSTHGFSRTALSVSTKGDVDNAEVIGYFDDVLSGGIRTQDLVNGLFNYATIYLFLVNWADLTQGILRLKRGWLGETVHLPDGSFTAELRGLNQALTQEFGNILTPYCRADLGDTRCKVPILPAPWQPSTAYALGSYIQPLAQTTDDLRIALLKCTTAGTSGTSEPSWNTTGGTTADGSAVWTSVTPYRLIGTVQTPIDQHSFVASPLQLRAGEMGNTAIISIRNNVSAGTALEIDDGVHAPVSIVWNFDRTGGGAAADIVSALGSSAAAITVVLSGLTITLTNNSGQQGNITKTGDIANPPALNIENFSDGYLDNGTLTWISGDNAGTSLEIKTYAGSGSIVVLWLGLNYATQVGDRFFYYPGCDKRRDTCVRKFANILNFRGEPDVPGLDAALGYPDE
jgi:hypothetical protein